MRSEAEIQAQIRLVSDRKGTPLLRNNSGALKDSEGRMVRFGLGNDSKRVNDNFKSADLIGIWPVQIEQHHVGLTLGQFFAVECKPEGWRKRPSDQRAEAQQNFGRWVQSHGGLFFFATKPEDVWK